MSKKANVSKPKPKPKPRPAPTGNTGTRGVPGGQEKGK